MKSNNSPNDFSLLNILYKYMGLLLGFIWPLLLILKDIKLSIFPQVFSVILTIIFFNILSIKSLLRNKALLISKTFIGLSNIFLITLLIYYTGGYESNLWIMFIFPLITISLICNKKTLLLATLAVSTILACFHLTQVKNLQVVHFGWLLLKISIFFIVSTLFKKVVDMEKDYENKFKIKSKELHRSKDYISNILESMLDCLIVIDLDNKIKTVNYATLNLLEYEKEEELIGQNVNIIFNDKTFLDKNLSKILFQKGAARDCDLVFLTKKNEAIPVNFNASTMKNESGKITGIVGIARDLRAIKELVEELREAEKEIKEYSVSLEKKVLLRTREIETLMAEEKSKMESMIKSMTEGVIMTDENGNLFFLNPTAEKIIGLSFNDNSQENQIEKWTDFRNLYLSELYSKIGSSFPTTKDIKLHQPPHTHLKVTLSRVKNHREEKLGIVTLLSDVTKEKKLEQMKMEFISLISHELRTPLTNMKGFASIMLNEISGKINE
ncbi:PAS domain S-box protein, partial [bacterium]|nr:PAS domain S-box protein [bacterium]